MHNRWKVLVLAAAATFLVHLQGAPADAVSKTPASTPPGGTGTVTLITGDRIHLTQVSGGGFAIGIQPGPGREHIGFFASSVRRGASEEITVLPADAAPLVAAGRLDAALCNVTGLIRQGLDDGRYPGVPLIVTSDGSAAAASALASNAGAVRTVRLLPSIDGAAVEADKRSAGTFWSGLKGDLMAV